MKINDEYAFMLSYGMEDADETLPTLEKSARGELKIDLGNLRGYINNGTIEWYMLVKEFGWQLLHLEPGEGKPFPSHRI